MKRLALTLVAGCLLFAACKKDDDFPEDCDDYRLCMNYNEEFYVRTNDMSSLPTIGNLALGHNVVDTASGFLRNVVISFGPAIEMKTYTVGNDAYFLYEEQRDGKRYKVQADEGTITVTEINNNLISGSFSVRDLPDSSADVSTRMVEGTFRNVVFR